MAGTALLTTLTTVAVATAPIWSTAVSISTSLYSANEQAKQARAQGKAQQNMADYNARVVEGQQTVANQNAKAEMAVATEESNRQHKLNREFSEKQRAMQAKTGGTFSGSALLMDADQLKEMKMSELDILHQGELRAREHKITGMQAGAQATGSRYQGDIAGKTANYRAKSLIQSGYVSAVGQGVSAVSKYAGTGAKSYFSSPKEQ